MARSSLVPRVHVEKRARTDLVPEHLAEAIRQILSLEALDTTVESWEFQISSPHSIKTWAASVGVSGVEGVQGITQTRLSSMDAENDDKKKNDDK
jgi:hypothetical protein